MKEKKDILTNMFGYQFSKLAPKNKIVTLNFKNGLTFKVRARTMDRTVVKEVFMEEIYDKHGIKVEKGDTVLDIGAHIGVFGVYAADISKTGMVYSFEPFLDNFKMLEDHKNINNCSNLKCFNDGVGDKKGKQTLYLSPDNNTGGHSLVLKTYSENTVEITTISLSEFCEEEKISTIDFLKLDCEGAEFNILERNEAILNRVNKIIMECHPFAENTVEKMIKLLERNNFSVIKESNNSPSGIAMLYARKK